MLIQPRTKLFYKTLAVFLALSFTATSVSWASPQAASYSLASQVSHLSLDQKLGRVDEVFIPEALPENSPFLIYLQDAHTNLGAQENISKIVCSLGKEFKVDAVLAEGGAEKLDFSALQSFEGQSIKEKASKHWLRESVLNGASFEAINGPRNYQFFGIEDKNSYDEGGKFFIETHLNSKSFLSALKPLIAENQKLRKEKYNKELLQFEDTFAKLESRHDLVPLVSQIANLARDLHIDRWKYEEIEKFVGLIILELEGGNPERFFEIQKTIDPRKLFEEIDLLKSDIKEKLFKTKEERAIDEEIRILSILKSIVSLEAAPAEYDFYVKNQNLIAQYIKMRKLGDAALHSAEAFYISSRLRDEKIFSNIKTVLNENQIKTAFLVTGGFHSAGITERLRKEKIPFILITPQISDEDNFDNYFARISGKRADLNEFSAKMRGGSAGFSDGKLKNQNAYAQPLPSAEELLTIRNSFDWMKKPSAIKTSVVPAEAGIQRFAFRAGMFVYGITNPGSSLAFSFVQTRRSEARQLHGTGTKPQLSSFTLPNFLVTYSVNQVYPDSQSSQWALENVEELLKAHFDKQNFSSLEAIGTRILNFQWRGRTFHFSYQSKMSGTKGHRIVRANHFEITEGTNPKVLVNGVILSRSEAGRAERSEARQTTRSEARTQTPKQQVAETLARIRNNKVADFLSQIVRDAFLEAFYFDLMHDRNDQEVETRLEMLFDELPGPYGQEATMLLEYTGRMKQDFQPVIQRELADVQDIDVYQESLIQKRLNTIRKSIGTKALEAYPEKPKLRIFRGENDSGNTRSEVRNQQSDQNERQAVEHYHKLATQRMEEEADKFYRMQLVQLRPFFPKDEKDEAILSRPEIQTFSAEEIGRLRPDQNVLFRGKLEIERIKHRLFLNHGFKVPPIIVLHIPVLGFYILDGHHRAYVSYKEGRSIEAYVIRFKHNPNDYDIPRTRFVVNGHNTLAQTHFELKPGIDEVLYLLRVLQISIPEILDPAYRLIEKFDETQRSILIGMISDLFKGNQYARGGFEAGVLIEALKRLPQGEAREVQIRADVFKTLFKNARNTKSIRLKSGVIIKSRSEARQSDELARAGRLPSVSSTLSRRDKRAEARMEYQSFVAHIVTSSGNEHKFKVLLPKELSDLGEVWTVAEDNIIPTLGYGTQRIEAFYENEDGESFLFWLYSESPIDLMTREMRFKPRSEARNEQEIQQFYEDLVQKSKQFAENRKRSMKKTYPNAIIGNQWLALWTNEHVIQFWTGTMTAFHLELSREINILKRANVSSQTHLKNLEKQMDAFVEQGKRSSKIQTNLDALTLIADMEEGRWADIPEDRYQETLKLQRELIELLRKNHGDYLNALTEAGTLLIESGLEDYLSRSEARNEADLVAERLTGKLEELRKLFLEPSRRRVQSNINKARNFIDEENASDVTAELNAAETAIRELKPPLNPQQKLKVDSLIADVRSGLKILERELNKTPEPVQAPKAVQPVKTPIPQKDMESEVQNLHERVRKNEHGFFDSHSYVGTVHLLDEAARSTGRKQMRKLIEAHKLLIQAGDFKNNETVEIKKILNQLIDLKPERKPIVREGVTGILNLLNEQFPEFKQKKADVGDLTKNTRISVQIVPAKDGSRESYVIEVQTAGKKIRFSVTEQNGVFYTLFYELVKRWNPEIENKTKLGFAPKISTLYSYAMRSEERSLGEGDKGRVNAFGDVSSNTAQSQSKARQQRQEQGSKLTQTYQESSLGTSGQSENTRPIINNTNMTIINRILRGIDGIFPNAPPIAAAMVRAWDIVKNDLDNASSLFGVQNEIINETYYSAVFGLSQEIIDLSSILRPNLSRAEARVNDQAINDFLKTHSQADLTFLLQPEQTILEPLEKEMLSARLRGEVLEQIAKKHALSRERVRQIVGKALRKGARYFKISEQRTQLLNLSPEALKEEPIGILGLNDYRFQMAFQNLSIRTIGDLFARTDQELLVHLNAALLSVLKKRLDDLGILERWNDAQAQRKLEELKKLQQLRAMDAEALANSSEPISLLGTFSIRLRKTFMRAGIKTIGDLFQTSEPELKEERNFGATTLQELRGKLEAVGLLEKWDSHREHHSEAWTERTFNFKTLEPRKRQNREWRWTEHALDLNDRTTFNYYRKFLEDIGSIGISEADPVILLVRRKDSNITHHFLVHGRADKMRFVALEPISEEEGIDFLAHYLANVVNRNQQPTAIPENIISIRNGNVIKDKRYFSLKIRSEVRVGDPFIAGSIDFLDREKIITYEQMAALREKVRFLGGHSEGLLNSMIVSLILSLEIGSGGLNKSNDYVNRMYAERLALSQKMGLQELSWLYLFDQIQLIRPEKDQKVHLGSSYDRHDLVFNSITDFELIYHNRGLNEWDRRELIILLDQTFPRSAATKLDWVQPEKFEEIYKTLFTGVVRSEARGNNVNGNYLTGYFQVTKPGYAKLSANSINRRFDQRFGNQTTEEVARGLSNNQDLFGQSDAIYELARRGANGYAPRIRDIIGEADRGDISKLFIVSSGIVALGILGDENDARLFIRKIQSGQTEPIVLAAAIYAFAHLIHNQKIKMPDLSLVVRQLKGWTVEVRLSALYALKLLQASQFMDSIKEVAENDRSREVRERAQDLLTYFEEIKASNFSAAEEGPKSRSEARDNKQVQKVAKELLSSEFNIYSGDVYLAVAQLTKGARADFIREVLRRNQVKKLSLVRAVDLEIGRSKQGLIEINVNDYPELSVMGPFSDFLLQLHRRLNKFGIDNSISGQFTDYVRLHISEDGNVVSTLRFPVSKPQSDRSEARAELNSQVLQTTKRVIDSESGEVYLTVLLQATASLKSVLITILKREKRLTPEGNLNVKDILSVEENRDGKSSIVPINKTTIETEYVDTSFRFVLKPGDPISVNEGNISYSVYSNGLHTLGEIEKVVLTKIDTNKLMLGSVRIESASGNSRLIPLSDKRQRLVNGEKIVFQLIPKEEGGDEGDLELEPLTPRSEARVRYLEASEDIDWVVAQLKVFPRVEEFISSLKQVGSALRLRDTREEAVIRLRDQILPEAQKNPFLSKILIPFRLGGGNSIKRQFGKKPIRNDTLKLTTALQLIVDELSPADAPGPVIFKFSDLGENRSETRSGEKVELRNLDHEFLEIKSGNETAKIALLNVYETERFGPEALIGISAPKLNIVNPDAKHKTAKHPASSYSMVIMGRTAQKSFSIGENIRVLVEAVGKDQAILTASSINPRIPVTIQKRFIPVPIGKGEPVSLGYREQTIFSTGARFYVDTIGQHNAKLVIHSIGEPIVHRSGFWDQKGLYRNHPTLRLDIHRRDSVQFGKYAVVYFKEVPSHRNQNRLEIEILKPEGITFETKLKEKRSETRAHLWKRDQGVLVEPNMPLEVKGHLTEIIVLGISGHHQPPVYSRQLGPGIIPRDYINNNWHYIPPARSEVRNEFQVDQKLNQIETILEEIESIPFEILQILDLATIARKFGETARIFDELAQYSMEPGQTERERILRARRDFLSDRFESRQDEVIARHFPLLRSEARTGAEIVNQVIRMLEEADERVILDKTGHFTDDDLWILEAAFQLHERRIPNLKHIDVANRAGVETETVFRRKRASSIVRTFVDHVIGYSLLKTKKANGRRSATGPEGPKARGEARQDRPYKIEGITRRAFEGAVLAGVLGFLGCGNSTAEEMQVVDYAEIKIDREKVLHPANFSLLGNNIGWVFSGEGIYDPKTDTFNQRAIDQLKALHVKVLRLGGTYADVYHWKDAVGPQDKRKPGVHVFLNQKMPSTFGTDEFLRLCDLLGADPLIVVNTLTGTSEEAAEWVRYTKGKVKYWEIGNEPYLETAGHKQPTAEEFASQYAAFAKAIRGADPKAQIGLPLSDDKAIRFLAENSIPPQAEHQKLVRWNNRVLTIVKQHPEAFPDFIALHDAYFPGYLLPNQTFDPKTGYDATMAAVEKVEAIQRDTKKLVRQILRKDIPIAITEYSAFFSLPDNRKNKPELTASTIGAVYTASLLIHFFKDKSLKMANFFSLLHNVYFGTLTEDDRPRPQFYALKIFADYVGEKIISSETVSSKFNSAAAGFVPVTKQVSALDVLVSRTGKDIYVIAVNKTGNPIKPSFSFAQNLNINTIEGVQLADSVDATNEKNDQVKPAAWSRENMDEVNQDQFPPYSITAFKISTRSEARHYTKENVQVAVIDRGYLNWGDNTLLRRNKQMLESIGVRNVLYFNKVEDARARLQNGKLPPIDILIVGDYLDEGVGATYILDHLSKREQQPIVILNTYSNHEIRVENSDEPKSPFDAFDFNTKSVVRYIRALKIKPVIPDKKIETPENMESALNQALDRLNQETNGEALGQKTGTVKSRAEVRNLPEFGLYELSIGTVAALMTQTAIKILEFKRYEKQFRPLAEKLGLPEEASKVFAMPVSSLRFTFGEGIQLERSELIQFLHDNEIFKIGDLFEKPTDEIRLTNQTPYDEIDQLGLLFFISFAGEEPVFPGRLSKATQLKLAYLLHKKFQNPKSAISALTIHRAEARQKNKYEKLTRAIIHERRMGYQKLAGWQPAVVHYGGARVPKDHLYYSRAVELGRKTAEYGFAIRTGAGDLGLMKAPYEGHVKVKRRGLQRQGVRILLPFEQKATSLVDDLIYSKYFLIRKINLQNQILGAISHHLPSREYQKKKNKELSDGMKKLSKMKPAVVFIGKPNPKVTPELLKVAANLANTLATRYRTNIRVASIGPVFDSIYNNALTHHWDDKLQAVMYVPEKGALPNGHAFGLEKQGRAVFLEDESNHQLMYGIDAEAFVFLPGGIGTMNKLFDLLTVMQTGKIRRRPIFAVGRKFYGPIKQALAETLYHRKDGLQFISLKDLDLFHVVDSEEEILDQLGLSKQRAEARQKVREALYGLSNNLMSELPGRWELYEAVARAAGKPELYYQERSMPIPILRWVDQKNVWENVASDPEVLRLLDREQTNYDAYMNRSQTWISQNIPFLKNKVVAYFSAEYGDHSPDPTNYSGGLGILSGDHVRGAADLGLNLIAVGLLYEEGYFRQLIAPDGSQMEYRNPQGGGLNRDKLPLEEIKRANGEPLIIDIPFPFGKTVKAKVWGMKYGHVQKILLDTNIEQNEPNNRAITENIYRERNGSWARAEQYIALGVGGRIALKELGIQPDVIHLNDGHPFLAPVASIALMMKDLESTVSDPQLRFEMAYEQVKRNTLFTTHTPIVAGNEVYENPQSVIRPFLQALFGDNQYAIDRLMSLGLVNGNFNLTLFSQRISNHHNGVSMLHGHVSRRMWKPFYPGVPESEVPIDAIVNSVHTGYRSPAGSYWQAPIVAKLFEQVLENKEVQKVVESDWETMKAKMESPEWDPWVDGLGVSDEEVWKAHTELKKALFQSVKRRFLARFNKVPGDDLSDLSEKDREYLAYLDTFDPEALTFGFARRFIDYKRALLMLDDLDKLEAISAKLDKPIQIIYAGKAHPKDENSKGIIKELHRRLEILRRNGKVRAVFVEEYNIGLARRLEPGVDIWLNNPVRPREASGTSGMKAAINMVPNLSTKDGWVVEGIVHGKNGFLFGVEEYKRNDLADREAFFSVLEREIIPLYQEPGKKNWIRIMKSAALTSVYRFGMERMLAAYSLNHYLPAAEDKLDLAQLEEIAKAKIEKRKIILTAFAGEMKPSVKIENYYPAESFRGNKISIHALVDLKNLKPEDMGVDLVVRNANDGKEVWYAMKPGEEIEKGKFRYAVDIEMPKAGNYDIRARLTSADQTIWHSEGELGSVTLWDTGRDRIQVYDQELLEYRANTQPETGFLFSMHISEQIPVEKVFFVSERTEWQAKAIPVVHIKDDLWGVVVDPQLAPNGYYEFKFVVQLADGRIKWLPEGHNNGIHIHSGDPLFSQKNAQTILNRLTTPVVEDEKAGLLRIIFSDLAPKGIIYSEPTNPIQLGVVHAQFPGRTLGKASNFKFYVHWGFNSGGDTWEDVRNTRMNVEIENGNISLTAELEVPKRAGTPQYKIIAVPKALQVAARPANKWGRDPRVIWSGKNHSFEIVSVTSLDEVERAEVRTQADHFKQEIRAANTLQKLGSLERQIKRGGSVSKRSQRKLLKEIHVREVRLKHPRRPRRSEARITDQLKQQIDHLIQTNDAAALSRLIKQTPKELIPEVPVYIVARLYDLKNISKPGTKAIAQKDRLAFRTAYGPVYNAIISVLGEDYVVKNGLIRFFPSVIAQRFFKPLPPSQRTALIQIAGLLNAAYRSRTNISVQTIGSLARSIHADLGEPFTEIAFSANRFANISHVYANNEYILGQVEEEVVRTIDRYLPEIQDKLAQLFGRPLLFFEDKDAFIFDEHVYSTSVLLAGTNRSEVHSRQARRGESDWQNLDVSQLAVIASRINNRMRELEDRGEVNSQEWEVLATQKGVITGLIRDKNQASLRPQPPKKLILPENLDRPESQKIQIDVTPGIETEQALPVKSELRQGSGIVVALNDLERSEVKQEFTGFLEHHKGENLRVVIAAPSVSPFLVEQELFKLLPQYGNGKLFVNYPVVIKTEGETHVIFNRAVDQLKQELGTSPVAVGREELITKLTRRDARKIEIRAGSLHDLFEAALLLSQVPDDVWFRIAGVDGVLDFTTTPINVIKNRIAAELQLQIAA